MGEVLGHEGKHKICSLRVRFEDLSFEKLLQQHIRIRKNSFPCE